MAKQPMGDRPRRAASEKERRRAGAGGWAWIAVALAGLVPALAFRLVLPAQPPGVTLLVFGVAILSAGFLLSWAVDVAEREIPQTLAVAFLAFIILLPEYSVDVYLAWTGADPATAEYSSYTGANMTGANRLLIGLAWPVLFLLFWMKRRRGVLQFDSGRTIELTFLLLGALYGLTIALKGFFSIFDGVVLLALFGLYIIRSSKMPSEERELIGPSAVMGDLVRAKRRAAAAGIFILCALVLVLAAEPFAEGLLKTSRSLARIHRRTALGTALEEASGCSSESGIMVLEQKPARKQGAPNRCCHRTNPTVSASSLTTIAWWPMPACSCRPP